MGIAFRVLRVCFLTMSQRDVYPAKADETKEDVSHIEEISHSDKVSPTPEGAYVQPTRAEQSGVFGRMMCVFSTLSFCREALAHITM